LKCSAICGGKVPLDNVPASALHTCAMLQMC